MAIILQTKLFFISTMSILLFIPCQAADESENFLVELDHKPIKEKLSHFRVYWHDIQSGSAPTSIEVVKSAPNASFVFGKVNMIDNPLTVGPKLSSKTVGKAQGFYAMASQEDLAALMAMNFVFTEGKYNGSTITILGRNAIINHVREMPVIGGSGFFQFARGYAQARTHTFDQKSGDATVQYDVYVKHY